MDVISNGSWLTQTSIFRQKRFAQGTTSTTTKAKGSIPASAIYCMSSPRSPAFPVSNYHYQNK